MNNSYGNQMQPGSQNMGGQLNPLGMMGQQQQQNPLGGHQNQGNGGNMSYGGNGNMGMGGGGGGGHGRRERRDRDQQNYGNNQAQTRTLWIGDVEPWMCEDDIMKQFYQIAPVTNVKLIRDKVKGTPLGYGFVEFPDEQTARDVFNELNGKRVPGSQNRFFKLNQASHGGGVARVPTQQQSGGGMSRRAPRMQQQQDQPEVTGYQIYVGDLDHQVTNPVLLQFFKQIYPSIFEAKVIVDPVSRVSKGFGFIKFENKEESEKALKEMNGQPIMGRPIKMNYASQRVRTNNQGPGGNQNQTRQNDGSNPQGRFGNQQQNQNQYGSSGGGGGGGPQNPYGQYGNAMPMGGQMNQFGPPSGGMQGPMPGMYPHQSGGYGQQPQMQFNQGRMMNAGLQGGYGMPMMAQQNFNSQQMMQPGAPGMPSSLMQMPMGMNQPNASGSQQQPGNMPSASFVQPPMGQNDPSRAMQSQASGLPSISGAGLPGYSQAPMAGTNPMMQRYPSGVSHGQPPLQQDPAAAPQMQPTYDMNQAATQQVYPPVVEKPSEPAQDVPADQQEPKKEPAGNASQQHASGMQAQPTQFKKGVVDPLTKEEIDSLNSEYLADAGTDIDDLFQI